MNSQQAWLKQVDRLEFYRKNNPSLLIRTYKRSEKEMFKEIGIFDNSDKALGYIRLFPQDFIVEEKTRSGIARVNNIRRDGDLVKENSDRRTLYANMTKIGIPTNIAAERISQALNIPLNRISFAGLKDADALTAQLVSFPRIKLSVADIIAREISNVYLSNFYYGQGALSPGDLEDNIFTITVRLNKPIAQWFDERIVSIATNGILNYFQSQRFGGLRLLSHKLGKLLMQGNYELVVRQFLFETNSDDIPLVKQLREKAKNLFPDWYRVKEVFTELPYIFFNEIKLLDYLINNPKNYIGGLITIKDQTQLWVYAYASYLFNKFLSRQSQRGDSIPRELPLLLSDNYDDTKIYRDYLKEDNIFDFKRILFPFKFIKLKQRFTPTRIIPKNISYKDFDGGVVINFTLPKAVYATTFLTNFFELHQGMPIPEWVNLQEIDPKELMGEGDIEDIKEMLKKSWYSKQKTGI